MATDPSQLSPDELQFFTGKGNAPSSAPAAPSSDQSLTPEEQKFFTSTKAPPPVATPAWYAPGGALHDLATATVGGMYDVGSNIVRNLGGTPNQLPADAQTAMAAHPYATTAGNILGGTAVGVPLALGAGEVAPLVGLGTGFGGAIGTGAATGAAQNLLTGNPDETWYRRAGIGAGLGAVLGAGTGALERYFGSGATITPAVQDAGNTAKGAGIDVLPENLPRAGGPGMATGAVANTDQTGQINKAFGKILGADVNDFSASTLGGPNGLTSQIGNQISTAANKGQIVATPKFASDIGDVLTAARDPTSLLDDTSKRAIQGQVQKISDALTAGNGTLTGQQFDTLTGAGSKLHDWIASSNQPLATVAKQLDGALRDGFQASSPPGVYTDWIDARTRFRLLKAIEDNVEHDPAGNIRPGSIMADVNRRFSDMPSQTGPGTVGQASDLARSVKTLFGGGGIPAGGVPKIPSPLPDWVTNALAYASRQYQASPGFAQSLLTRGQQPAANYLNPWVVPPAVAATPNALQQR
jgi:hypothetical protein